MSLSYNTDLSKMPALTTGHTHNADNPFEPFFGPVSVQDGQNVSAESVFAHEAYNLPEAYKGRNLFLGDMLDFLITRTDDWYTSRVMPFRATDQIHVSWNVFRFNKTMADLQPHQGIPRYITAESEEHSDSLVRRGLAFIVEHGFWSTERGKQHYLLNLENITESVHMTVYYGVLHALLSGKGHWKEWQRQYGRRTSRVDDLLRMERNRWAIAQKSERGMYLLDAELKDMMKYKNVSPDTWILPSKMSIYLTMVPSNEVSYSDAGNSLAVKNNNDISAPPKSLVTFRGSTVCETMPFDTDFSGEPTELLRREKMCGSYYTMLPHNEASVYQFGTSQATGYRSDHRSIFIYNCDVDRFEKIGLEEALDSCMRFDSAGNLSTAHVSVAREAGVPSARDVTMNDDPLMCTHGGARGVCRVLGDIPESHLPTKLLKIITNKIAKSAKGGAAAAMTGYTTATSNGTRRVLTQKGGSIVYPKSALIRDPSVRIALINAWDPALAPSLHGSSVGTVTASDLQQRFEASFPEQWKSLLSADDFAYARNKVVSEAKALQNDKSAYINYMENVNDKYAEHLTDRAVNSRSSFSAAGVMSAAVSEIESPSTKKRLSAQEKRVKEFVSKFESTSNYWQRHNTELKNSSDVIREIMRNYIQPLSASDASLMESKIEAAVDAGETLTPGALDNAKKELLQVTEPSNLSKLSRDLEAAGREIENTGAGIAVGGSRDDLKKITPGNEQDTTEGQRMMRDFLGVSGTGGTASSDSAESDELGNRKSKYPSTTTLTSQANFDAEVGAASIVINKKNLQKMIEDDIPFPFGFLLVRPFQRYDMCSAILCRAGARLGQTFIGHSDFQLADNVINKTHVGHYTFYSKSIVHDEKEYVIAEDVFAAGYKGGENTTMYSSKEDFVDDVRAESFSHSILSFLIPYRTNQPRGPRIQNPIDITGKLHPTLYQDTDIPARQVEAAMYPGARYYCEVLQLKELSSYASDATEHFLSPYKYINTVCFQGHQFMYNASQNGFTDKIRNTGHWGPHGVYAGCKSVRCGDNAFFDDQDRDSPM
ncbi:MAG: hypothetical protein CMO44_13405 [Verrucomicrobiales bacterium]|nr:hypothetical protein [Verrucomicrobiales bacterium]